MRDPRALVFAGPSLPAVRRVDDDEVVFAPPIRRGDLERFSHHDVLVMIDGEFGQNLAVSPKEILAAMASGRRVIGASSMGALRASELDRLGMIGVGWIYERFARSVVRYDDDVALTFSPIDHAPLTVPLVNVLYSVERAIASAAMTPDEGRWIEDRCRSIFYPDRDADAVSGIFADVIGVDRHARLQDEWDGPVLDVKEIDAIAALTAARDMTRSRVSRVVGHTAEVGSGSTPKA